MHNSESVGRVWMGVVFGGTAMRGPAGVTNSDRSVERPLLQQGFEIAQLALGAAAFQLAILQRGDPR